MPVAVPVYLATMAACGSLVTSVKSGWELSRMVRKKLDEKNVGDEARIIHYRLRKAYDAGVMSCSEYDKWYEKFLLAKAEKDMIAMNKIAAHLRIIWNRRDHSKPYVKHHEKYNEKYHEKPALPSHQHGHKTQRQEHGRRRSVSFDTRRVTVPYVPNAPRLREGDETDSTESSDYRSFNEKTDAAVQLARLQRRSSTTYPRKRAASDRTRKATERETTVEHHSSSDDTRGRSRSREFTRYKGYDTEDENEGRPRHSRRARGYSSDPSSRGSYRDESVPRYRSIQQRSTRYEMNNDDDSDGKPVYYERSSRRSVRQ